MRTILIKSPLYILLIVATISSSGCLREDKAANNPYGNFDALWNIIDQRYCYLDYKEINWDKINIKYRQEINKQMSDDELFSVLARMLDELKDGHVNLSSSFNVSRYWKWFEDRPHNFNERVVDKYYLNFDYKMAAGMKYKLLPNNVGYIYYGNFSSGIGQTGLDHILASMTSSNGLIIDLRDNGGGSLSNVNEFASRFINEKILTGYIQHKTGPGHSDFSEPYATYLSPSSRIRYQKKVVLLTNANCYSATNNFVSIMHELPQVTVVGDRTGGGSGLPFSSELPNGWSIRFSACPIYNSKMENTEFGIYPDIAVDLDESLALKGIDTMMDKAIEVITGEKREREYLSEYK